MLLVLLLVPCALMAQTDDATLAKVQQAIQEKGLNWTAGPSIFTPAEFRARLGMHLTRGANQVCLPENEMQPMDLPASLNYIALGDVSAVKNQAQCGGCWAFAAIGALESAAIREGNYPQSIDLSEQYLLSCDSGEGNCNGAYDMDQPMAFLCGNGTVDASCDPFRAQLGQELSCSPCSNAQQDLYHGAAHGDVSQAVDALKQGLVTYGPIATTMEVYQDFMYYTGGVYSYSYGSDEGGHAVLIVGYDDSGSYFIVKNSWGASWGDHGYFMIAYSEVTGQSDFGANSTWIQFGTGPNGQDDDNDDNDNDDNDTDNNSDDDTNNGGDDDDDDDSGNGAAPPAKSVTTTSTTGCGGQ
jgi:C1A family cysteine protease